MRTDLPVFERFTACRLLSTASKSGALSPGFNSGPTSVRGFPLRVVAPGLSIDSPVIGNNFSYCSNPSLTRAQRSLVTRRARELGLFLRQDEPEGGILPSGYSSQKCRERLSLEQIRAFLEASQRVEFQGRNREAVYDWVNQMCGRFATKTCSGAGEDWSAVRRQADGPEPRAGEEVKPKSHRHGFGQRYGREDIVRQEKVQLSTLRAGAFYCSSRPHLRRP